MNGVRAPEQERTCGRGTHRTRRTSCSCTPRDALRAGWFVCVSTTNPPPPPLDPIRGKFARFARLSQKGRARHTKGCSAVPCLIRSLTDAALLAPTGNRGGARAKCSFTQGGTGNSGVQPVSYKSTGNFQQRHQFTTCNLRVQTCSNQPKTNQPTQPNQP